VETDLRCPCCDQKLRIEPRDNGFIVWCDFGRCYSETASNGGFGKSEMSAFSNLCARIDEESD
jgi:hypothetical protein